jgi:hypothetical protein
MEWTTVQVVTEVHIYIIQILINNGDNAKNAIKILMDVYYVVVMGADAINVILTIYY